MKNATREDFEWTDNSPLYNKAYKLHRAQEGAISCPICGWHKWENSKWHSQDRRCWKKYRKYQCKDRN
jgi:hypothetical protein